MVNKEGQEKKFEFLEHTADIKFRAYGETINNLFESCVLAFSSFVSRGKKIDSKKGKVISVHGNDYESLLYNFVDELIYLLDTGFVVSKAKIELRGFNLKAELYGDDIKKYNLEGVKAATYAEMHVKKIKLKGKDIWEAQMVLDV